MTAATVPIDNYLVYMYSRTHDEESYSPLQSDEHVEAEMDAAEFEEILRDSADSVCRDEIGVEYIRKAYLRADIILMMLNLTGDEVQMDGFIFGHEFTDMYGTPAIDLDVVCARQYGGLLLQKCIRYCQTLRSYQYIELSALPNVIGFYARYGFSFRGDCNPEHKADLTVTPEVSDRFRRAGDDTARNPALVSILYSLHRLGYTPLSAPKECYDTEMSRAAYLAHGCYGNGLEMRLCLADDDIVASKASDKRANAIHKLQTMIQRDDDMIDKLYESGELNDNTRRRIMQHSRTLGRYKAQLRGEAYEGKNSNSDNGISNNSNN